MPWSPPSLQGPSTTFLEIESAIAVGCTSLVVVEDEIGILGALEQPAAHARIRVIRMELLLFMHYFNIHTLCTQVSISNQKVLSQFAQRPLNRGKFSLCVKQHFLRVLHHLRRRLGHVAGVGQLAFVAAHGALSIREQLC